MKIMICYDGSSVSRAALNLGVQHAWAFMADAVFLVQSMEGGLHIGRREFDNAERKLGAVCAELRDEGLPIEPRLLVRGMSAGEDLVRFAEERQVDEIIIGIRRRSKVGKMVFGSTAQSVILRAPCPVVTVKSLQSG